MCTSLPLSAFTCFLLQVVHPLYRTSTAPVSRRVVTVEGVGADSSSAELRDFSSSILELIQKTVGTPLFLAAYNHIRSGIQKVRQVRQTKRKQLVLLNPVAAANRKQNKHDSKRLAKKRKIKVLKETGGRGIGNNSGKQMELPFDINSAVAAPSVLEQRMSAISQPKQKKQKTQA